MTDFPHINKICPTLPSMLRKYDRYARRDCFRGSTAVELKAWQADMRLLLWDLIGLGKMETCLVISYAAGCERLPDGIVREHVYIMTEPEVWMPVYILKPPGADKHTRVFICPPGHNGAGKYTVAGCSEYAAVRDRIEWYNYDYGRQLAGLGYVAVCPDCRGFGERREELTEANSPETALKGDCLRLAHMGEPLGIPVAGMLVWDLMRLTDYLVERNEWDVSAIGCAGFSGGGMQALMLSALDERISPVVISGYMYGCRDALLTLNTNCSCNYVPRLWEHLDMGDTASLIAPRPLIVQSCRDDRLNGPRGIINAIEQVDIIRKAYRLLDAEDCLVHEICEGPHRWHGSEAARDLELIMGRRGQK